MSEILFRYERVNPTTWAYLSSLLSLALFFKFNRFWTVRNLDLVLMIFLAPALLCIKFGLDQAGMVEAAASVEQLGYIWLFSVHTLVLLRALLDPIMVRRPLLEANLSVGGLTFLAISLLLFLTANVITGEPVEADLFAAQRADYLATLEASDLENSSIKTHGPGFTLLYQLPPIATQRLMGPEADAPQPAEGEPPPDEDATAPRVTRGDATTARVMTIVSQLLIVVGIILVAARHFDNLATGVAAATCYLLLPYTAMWTGNVTHTLPGALLVWAVLLYRRPLFSGALIGLLCGTVYYPAFLLPLWLAFYWRRGAWRFGSGVVFALLMLIITIVASSSSGEMVFARLQQMFGLQIPIQEGFSGIWNTWNTYYRWPLIALFVGMATSFVFWPAQKNLATLMSCSAALMVGAQFWHAHSGGMALAWYLPVLLLMIFRPNLEDRVAVEVVAPLRRAAKKKATP